MREKNIQNDIRLAISTIAVVFRANVGRFITNDGRYIQTGLPNGFSDLFGFLKKDGRAFFLEVKTDKGRLSKEQSNFLEQMSKYGAITGVVRSVEEAMEVLSNG